LVWKKGLGPWQTIEHYNACGRRVHDPSSPLIVVLAESEHAPGLPFLRRLHCIVTRFEPAAASRGEFAVQRADFFHRLRSLSRSLLLICPSESP
jgi:hypothetical protein